MDSPTHNTSLLGRAKAIVPVPLKAAMRPAVRVLAPRLISETAPSTDALAFCAQPVGNQWTVHNPVTGRTHKYFFLCGCWRSGTHWVSRVLNLHPDVNIVGEFHLELFTRALRKYQQRKWCLGSRPRYSRIAERAVTDLVRRSMFAATRRKPEATWIGEHTPRRLFEVLPGAPTVLVVRDGRDVMISQAFHSLRAKKLEFFRPAFRQMAAVHLPAFRDNPDSFKGVRKGFLLEKLWVRRQARGWAKRLQADLEARERMIAAGTPVHLIGYEDLHSDFESRRAELYEFFGLAPKLAIPASQSSKTLPGFRQEDPTSKERKGEVGDWRNYFDAELAGIFKKEAGEALIQAGYEKDLTW